MVARIPPGAARASGAKLLMAGRVYERAKNCTAWRLRRGVPYKNDEAEYAAYRRALRGEA